MKLMTPDRQCSGTIEGSEIAWNRGHAVWFDSCTSVLERVVRGNFIHDNEGIGVFLELTRGAEVVNNLIVSNRAGGIFISGSERIRAWHNTLVGNVGLADIYVYGLPRVMGWEVGQPEWAVLVSNQILNNIVCSLCTNDIGIPPDNAATNEFTLGNRSDFNCFFRPDGRYRFAWGGVAGYTQWVDWSAATGWDSNSLAANPLLVWSNHAFPVPVTTSPVVDRAASILGVTTDGRGVPRPLDGNGDGQAAPDIGAVEAVHATADTDGDGLSDAAEQDVHRTSPVQEDTDGDRFRDGAEVAAGTCPTNAHSYLGMLQPVAEAGPSSLVVRWTSAVDRRYDLYQSTNLLLAFAPLVTNIEATPPTNEYPLAPAVPAGFYRVNLAP
jgi:parallel beta-helix repeat protein